MTVNWETAPAILKHLICVPDALEYHNKMSSLHKVKANIHESVQDQQATVKEQETSSRPPIDEPLHYVATEAHNAMEEFSKINCRNSIIDVSHMISLLNDGQLIF